MCYFSPPTFIEQCLPALALYLCVSMFIGEGVNVYWKASGIYINGSVQYSLCVHLLGV